MMRFADLRNVIVHDRFDRFAYLSIPTEEVVTEIQAIRQRLLKPRTAYDEFKREVLSVKLQDPLASVLEMVKTSDITQFPVYDEDTFVGLVTSNGVMRWLARRLSPDMPLVAFDEATVSDLLANEEERPAWKFVHRRTPVAEVAYAFQETPELEAVLVTENGSSTEKLLGIAVLWDVAQLQV